MFRYPVNLLELSSTLVSFSEFLDQARIMTACLSDLTISHLPLIGCLTCVCRSLRRKKGVAEDCRLTRKPTSIA